MKKLLHFLALGALLCIPWVTQAQSPLTIGTGTDYSASGSSADGQGSPMGNTYYYNSAAQFIYTAEELASMGGAKAITSVAFYHNANSFSNNIKIYLAHTTATTVDPSSPATTPTLVYSGTGVTIGGSSAGWQTFTFDNPFNYNGNDNLLVVVCRVNNSSGYNSSQNWQYTVTTDNKYMVRHSDTQAYGDITNTTYSYTASTKRPNIQITYAEPATCFKPQNLAATLTPGNGTIATLTWERNASGTEDAWVLEYGTASDFTGATSVNVTGGTPSKDLTNLNAEQTYYARVKPDCDNDGTKWSNSISFFPTNALTVTVGDETTTSYYAPIRYGSGTQSEFVYPANMLTALNGKTLTSVKFYASTTSATYTNNVTVYMQEVSGTTESTSAWLYNQSTATKVYEGTTLAVTDGEMVITFSTPFEYNGGNLCFNIWAATSAPSVYWKGFDPGYASCGFDYSITPPVSSPYSTAQFLPKATFEFENNLYPKPTNLAVTNLTATGTTITWEAPSSDVTGYKYQYREQGGTWSALTSTTTLSAPLTSLTGNTTYEFQVQAIYAGDNESGFASKSFTTPCAAFSVDPTAYTYGFEDAADMDCWTLVNGVTNTDVWDNATMQSNLGYEPARTGDNVFMFYYVDYDDTDPEYQTLISPELTDIPSTGLHVEFYYVGDMGGGGQETFRVGYSTTDNNLSSFTWGNEITNASTAYQRFSANYPAGTKYVAIQHTSDDQYYLFIDDITFEGAAACLEPTAVAANNITTTGAEITWTNGGEETAWDIFVTNDNTVVPDDLTTPTVAGTSTKPYPLTGLTHSTTYYVYVRSACSSTEHSAWSTPLTFHTECEGMDLPYSYGFEDGALSVCWNVLNTNTSYNNVTIGDGNANTGTHSLNFFRGSTTGDLVAVLPEVGAYDLSDYQFEFSAKGTYAGYEITVGIMTDPDDLTTFVPQGSAITTTTSYAEYLARFNEYTGSGKYVAIKVVRPSTVNYGNIYIDDIAINPLPSCIEPDGLTVSNEAPHGATFEWTENGTATAWQLYISENNTAPSAAETNVIAATSNPFTLTTGLDPETDYYVWVRANCGNTDGYSTWVGPETFQTTIACPAPTGLAASNITNHTADLTWTGTSDEYIVSYRTAAYTNGSEEDFSSAPDGWIFRQGALNNDGTASLSGTSSWTRSTSNEVFNTHMYMNLYSTKNYWLITPSLTINDGDALSFDLAYTPYSNSNPLATGCPTHRFAVLISTDNMATWTILREWNNSGSAYVLDNVSQTGENSGAIDLSAYTGANAYIAFFGHSETSSYDNNFHFDNVTIGTPVAAGAWQTVNPNPDASPVTITGLTPETKYEAKVQGDCGTEGLSAETASIPFTTDIPCPAPSGLTATNPKSNSIDLSWTNGGSEDWVVAYKAASETDFSEVDVNIADVTVGANNISYTLTGLHAETDYIVKVLDNCEASYAGDGMSEWTAEVPFGTIAACSAMDPVVSAITHHNATVTWDGESATGFTVNYKTAAGIDGLSEEFNTSNVPEGWTKYTGLLSDVMGGTATLSTTTYGWNFSNTNVFGAYHTKLNIYGTSCKYWLVTPNVNLANGSTLQFDLALTDYNSEAGLDVPTGQADDKFVVLITTDNMENWSILREWNNSGSEYIYNNIPNTADNHITIDLSAYTGDVKIAFYGESTVSASNEDNDLHIDNVTIGVTVPAGSWQTQAAATTTADLTGLTAGTKYDLKVVPNCDETLESSTVQFTTLPANNKYFLTAGDWNTASNWMDEEMPTTTDNAIIRANATIPNGTVATAKNITFEGTPTLTLADGGQLIANNSVSLTVQKSATANSWMGISAPVFSSYSSSYLNYTSSTNLKEAGAYDLMQYTESSSTWQSQKSTSYSYMSQERGYIYRRADATTLTFTGSTHVGNQSASVVTWSASDASLKGFNLIGNPYPHAIYYGAAIPTTNLAAGFYILQTNGTWRTVAGADINTTAIGVGEAILVKASDAISPFEMTDVATAPTSSKAHTATLAFTVSNDEYSDVAYAMFSNGEGLPKMSHLNAEAPMLYIPTDEGRYAIAMMEESVESFPLNFNGYGEYTLSMNNSTAFGYLHLIDRATGRDIDLLSQSTYTFNANGSSDRFTVKLSPSMEENGRAIFVWQENGNVVIEGDGDLQVFDVMGRQTGTTHVDGTTTFSRGDLGMSHSGVYVLRLNGNSQKIVVK